MAWTSANRNSDVCESKLGRPQIEARASANRTSVVRLQIQKLCLQFEFASANSELTSAYSELASANSEFYYYVSKMMPIGRVYDYASKLCAPGRFGRASANSQFASANYVTRVSLLFDSCVIAT